MTIPPNNSQVTKTIPHRDTVQEILVTSFPSSPNIKTETEDKIQQVGSSAIHPGSSQAFEIEQKLKELTETKKYT